MDDKMRSFAGGVKTTIVLLLATVLFSTARADDAADLAKLQTQFDAFSKANKVTQAEAVGKQALAIAQRSGKARDVITWLDQLSALYRAAGRYGDAEPYNKRALEEEGKLSGTDSLNYAQG